ncbi:amino acid permease [Candidatus Purcelliella pentastirinorum]|uniref:amino acid permease n=1 Tax=Candidatus Purcelliella pentastirinorum TaxID=472834 RepID=UPI002367C4FB|nr:amino acid permease [Candidatus Purcelliella pentastirinorum]WDI78832.1 amino acid permease [Candidatus Purcelliella pentastirinorum]WDR79965.1 amino acid permease [Candidatus Purcelliella pentastirinorum]
MKIKHIIMMTIGSSIGTGLFISLGNAIVKYGTILTIISYILISIMIYFLMNIIGELTTLIPKSESFTNYGSKYVEEGFGFSLGWNYWYNWVLTITINLVSTQIIMGYWYPQIPSYIWGIIFLTIIFSINFLSIKNFGEIEYWLSLIKIVAIFTFLIIGSITIINIIQKKEILINWITIKNNFYKNNIYTFINITTIIGFSFQGIELIAITAKEIKNPQKNIKKIINKIFWIIQILYISVIITIIIITNHEKNFLIEKNNIENIIISPFTLIFKNSKLINTASIINFIILIAILSSSNAGLYASSRMLYTLAMDGKAPKIFSNLSKNGVPKYALYLTTIISGCYLIYYKTNIQKIYIELIKISSITGFITWLGIIIIHYRFKIGYKKLKNKNKKKTYKCKYFPIGSIFSFILCMIITLGQTYITLSSNNLQLKEIITTYMGIPLFLTNWLCYKIIFKSKIIKYNDMNFNYKKKINKK